MWVNNFLNDITLSFRQETVRARANWICKGDGISLNVVFHVLLTVIDPDIKAIAIGSPVFVYSRDPEREFRNAPVAVYLSGCPFSGDKELLIRDSATTVDDVHSIRIDYGEGAALRNPANLLCCLWFTD